ncbi:uncharacterized protein KY384_005365 [Bacidia gigantensis]|uniref:uncharacterized protein n=1 Tax=Bacidia gigantensis TaxID=2732470 RepID=UPI001D046060|nr:uncharacterized protein KY384_005365 [Bacidia gigantensis]KAG8529884.1 hypothetical protein KY384_005365 [Bacidia gigantensis]
MVPISYKMDDDIMNHVAHENQHVAKGNDSQCLLSILDMPFEVVGVPFEATLYTILQGCSLEIVPDPLLYVKIAQEVAKVDGSTTDVGSASPPPDTPPTAPDERQWDPMGIMRSNTRWAALQSWKDETAAEVDRILEEVGGFSLNSHKSRLCSDLAERSSGADMAPQITQRTQQIWLQDSDPEVRLYYTESLPVSEHCKGTILLIHGFPETSYQFRHVVKPLAEAGYRTIAPDYRGAGFSSHPPGGYTKDILSQDLHTLLVEHLNIKDPIHIVGHDIGGMIAFAYVSQFPDDVASIAWGECPLPGTKHYETNKHTPPLWHFSFHAQPDIPEALVAGKERMYIKHFYDRLAQKPSAFTNEDLDFYATQYSMPGALRCGFNAYRMFKKDAAHNQNWLSNMGKVKVKNMILSGERSLVAKGAVEMAEEVFENVTPGFVEGSGHWIAEENPEDFVKKVLAFIEH